MTFDRMIVLDFETTGLQPGYRPVEIAWLEFDSLYKVSQSVTSLIDPQIPIEPVSYTHLTLPTKRIV